VTAADAVRQTRITQVWHWLGGREIRKNRSQAFWRSGDGWSVSLSDDRGAWFDHRDGIGGGVLDLIQHVRGGSRADALHWLADSGGVPLNNRPLSPPDRRRYAQARRDAPELGRVALLWWIERRRELEEYKAEALERGDLAALIEPAREHHLLGLLGAEGIVRAYLRAAGEQPEHTAALVGDGERWAQWSAAAIAALIAQWAREAGASL
jgi:hypothetical protein